MSHPMLGMIAVLAFIAIIAVTFALLVWAMSRRDTTPAAPLLTPHPKRTRQVLQWLRRVGSLALPPIRRWLSLLANVLRLVRAARHRLRSQRARLAPFPEPPIHRIALCHRPLTVAGHRVIVSDFPGGRSRATLRPRSRPSDRIDLGELDTGPASDLAFLRLAKQHRVS